ncbi:MAG: hypothetical protein JEZ11_04740 [Desulfobacterales bacterium]|nr:hypothetical protein [Desulfobacterales bacterium]
MLAILAVVLMLVIGVTAAEAYVLQGAHVLDLMIGRLGRVRGLEVHQQVTLYDDRFSEGGTAVLNEIARYRPPHAFRSDTTSDRINRIHLQLDRSALTVLDGRLSDTAETPYDRYKDLLLVRDRKLLEKQLARLGVDVTVSSLGRFENHIAFVVGARYPDDTRSQVWIDKETFTPLRWLMRRPDDPPGAGLEVQYRNWAKHGPIQHPMQVTFIEDGRLVREIRVQRLVVNPALEDDLFDLAAIRAEAQSHHGIDDAAAVEDRPAGSAGKATEDFKTHYE